MPAGQLVWRDPAVAGFSRLERQAAPRCQQPDPGHRGLLPVMSEPSTKSNRVPLIVPARAWVVLPFAYGVYQLFLKLVQLFG